MLKLPRTMCCILSHLSIVLSSSQPLNNNIKTHNCNKNDKEDGKYNTTNNDFGSLMQFRYEKFHWSALLFWYCIISVRQAGEYIICSRLKIQLERCCAVLAVLLCVIVQSYELHGIKLDKCTTSCWLCWNYIQIASTEKHSVPDSSGSKIELSINSRSTEWVFAPTWGYYEPPVVRRPQDRGSPKSLRVILSMR